MNKLFTFLFGVVIMAYANGCFSVGATAYHNSTAATQAQVFQATRLSGGEPAFGINWAAVTPGYTAAWANSPGMMAGATAADLVATGLIIYYATQGSDSGDGPDMPQVQVNGNNNTTYVNGDGTQTTTIDQSSQGQ